MVFGCLLYAERFRHILILLLLFHYKLERNSIFKSYYYSNLLMMLFYAEFIYPADWVGDRTLLYRIVDKAEAQRPLDPPSPITGETAGRPPRNVNEPVVAFGPPGSTGELNVSVIVSPVPQDFSYSTKSNLQVLCSLIPVNIIPQLIFAE